MPAWPLRWGRLSAIVAALGLSVFLFHAIAARGQSAGAPASGAARIWFYQTYDPYVNRNYATVTVNGAAAGSVSPYGGVVYRDVPPGRYRLGVESFGNAGEQTVDIDLAPGQQVYLKLLNLPSWASDGDVSSFERDTYSLRLMPPQIAIAEMSRKP